MRAGAIPALEDARVSSAGLNIASFGELFPAGARPRRRVPAFPSADDQLAAAARSRQAALGTSRADAVALMLSNRSRRSR
jgi:hypothetical protein